MPISPLAAALLGQDTGIDTADEMLQAARNQTAYALLNQDYRVPPNIADYGGAGITTFKGTQRGRHLAFGNEPTPRIAENMMGRGLAPTFEIAADWQAPHYTNLERAYNQDIAHWQHMTNLDKAKEFQAAGAIGRDALYNLDPTQGAMLQLLQQEMQNTGMTANQALDAFQQRFSGDGTAAPAIDPLANLAQEFVPEVPFGTYMERARATGAANKDIINQTLQDFPAEHIAAELLNHPIDALFNLRTDPLMRELANNPQVRRAADAQVRLADQFDLGDVFGVPLFNKAVVRNRHRALYGKQNQPQQEQPTRRTAPQTPQEQTRLVPNENEEQERLRQLAFEYMQQMAPQLDQQTPPLQGTNQGATVPPGREQAPGEPLRAILEEYLSELIPPLPQGPYREYRGLRRR
jgi:hypothetical protein